MFDLSEKQKETIIKWKMSRNCLLGQGASGGRWTYSFTPTSLGLVINVIDNLIKEDNILDLTDYENW